MTTAENLNRIIQAKSDIKTAIENKGVSVGDITIDGYAEKINQITVGESGKTVLPNGIRLNGSTWETFDTTQYDWSKIRDMSFMFQSCSNLTSFDVSNWDTSNVTTMYYMFDGCSSLTSLDVSNWNTSKVTTMSNMFNSCSSLTSLDVSSWDTSNVTDMGTMFKDCSNLTELKMGGDVSKLENAYGMFYGITTTGTFYYNPQYDYSKIIAVLPSTWTAVPME